MKKFSLTIIFLVFFGLAVFGETGEQKEIDYLLFMPDSGSSFVNESQAGIQLDTIARYLREQSLVGGQIIVYGYTAFAANDVDSLGLSRQRALFIISELQKRGISRNLFADPVGYGSVDLWGSNMTEADQAPNRRVRILVDGKVITPETIAEPKQASEIPIIAKAEEPKPVEKPDFKIPWQVLIPLLLIPLIFILLRLLTNRKKEAPAAKTLPIEPAAPSVEKIEDIVNLEEEIRRRAYFISLSHAEYSDMNGDWFTALPEVCAEYEAKGYQTYIEDGSWWAKKTVLSEIKIPK